MRTPEFIGRLICAAGAILVLNGCSAEKPLSTSHKITTPIAEPVLRYPEISAYYPTLENYPLLSNGEFSTSRAHTKWFNFTKADFNPAIAKATFEFFEELAKKSPVLQYSLGNQNIPFILNAKSRTNRVIFIIPDNAPLPANWEDPANEGSTTSIFDGVYVTFVRFHDSNATIPLNPSFNNTKLAFSKVFNVEAFQSSILVSSANTQLANLGQEITANSYGPAFTAKQMLVSYSDYATWAKGTQIRRDSQSPWYPLYVLPEEEYQELPAIGFPTK